MTMPASPSHEWPQDWFWRQVREVADGCWLWTGHRQTNGAGQVTGHGRRGVLAHRFAYELARGPIPTATQIQHMCGVRLCCNPDHLVLVADAPLTPDQVRAIRELANRGESYRDIGREYGVSRTTVGNIARRRAWRDV
jgi:hypothetical protein